MAAVKTGNLIPGGVAEVNAQALQGMLDKTGRKGKDVLMLGDGVALSIKSGPGRPSRWKLEITL